MVSKAYTITAKEGLHARPCSLIVTEAMKHKADLSLAYNESEKNLKSIMAIMALGVPHNATIEIRANGADEKAALEAINAIIYAEKLAQ